MPLTDNRVVFLHIIRDLDIPLRIGGIPFIDAFHSGAPAVEAAAGIQIAGGKSFGDNINPFRFGGKAGLSIAEHVVWAEHLCPFGAFQRERRS